MQRMDFIKKIISDMQIRSLISKKNFIKSVMVNDYFFVNLVGLSIDTFVVGLAFLSTRYIINFYLN